MDKEVVKERLSAYRSGSEDASDPHFAEALRAAERDEELAAWFADSQRFDAEMTSLLQQTPAPAGLREAILKGDPAPLPSKVIRHSFAPWLAAAAAVVAAFFIGRISGPAPSSRVGDGSLAMQAISYSGQMPRLDFVCFDSDEVKGWINHQSAAMQMGALIDKPMSNMQMIGSSATQWSGKPVIMIALQNGRRMGMLYLLRAADFPEAAGEEGHVIERDGWASKVGRRGEHVFVLTTHGTRDDLDFPMPL